MSVCKNFHFDDEVARHLEEIAKLEEKTQTQVTIEQMYKKISIKKKLVLLDKITGSLTGKIGNIDAKSARIEYVFEKYVK